MLQQHFKLYPIARIVCLEKLNEDVVDGIGSALPRKKCFYYTKSVSRSCAVYAHSPYNCTTQRPSTNQLTTWYFSTAIFIARHCSARFSRFDAALRLAGWLTATTQLPNYNSARLRHTGGKLTSTTNDDDDDYEWLQHYIIVAAAVCWLLALRYYTSSFSFSSSSGGRSAGRLHIVVI